MTVAAFMDLALYHPQFGYYARAAQRSGRAGDFFTSVDVGPIFGDALAIQLAEMARIIANVADRDARTSPDHSSQPNVGLTLPPFDLVEAGAGNGRLSADIVRAARHRDPSFEK